MAETSAASGCCYTHVAKGKSWIDLDTRVRVKYVSLMLGKEIRQGDCCQGKAIVWYNTLVPTRSYALIHDSSVAWPVQLVAGKYKLYNGRGV